MCKPGGRVTVCDVFTTSAEQAELYDRLGRHRDPSHTHALQLAELDALLTGLTDVRREFYRYPVKADELLSRSFPRSGRGRGVPGDGRGRRRPRPHRDRGQRDGGLSFSFPVVVVSGVRY